MALMNSLRNYLLWPIDCGRFGLLIQTFWLVFPSPKVCLTSYEE